MVSLCCISNSQFVVYQYLCELTSLTALTIFMYRYLGFSVRKTSSFWQLYPNSSSKEWEPLSPPACSPLAGLSDQLSSTVHMCFLETREVLIHTCDRRVSKAFAESGEQLQGFWIPCSFLSVSCKHDASFLHSLFLSWFWVALLSFSQ